MANGNEAASPASPSQEAKPGDGKKASGNLDGNQAAAALYARTLKAEQAAAATQAQTPSPTATGEKPPAEAAPAPQAEEAPADTPPNDAPVAGEANPSSVEPGAEGEAAPAEAEAAEPEAEADPVLSPETTLSEEAKEYLKKRLTKFAAREAAKTKAMKETFDEKEKGWTSRLAELEAKVSTTEPSKPQAPVVVNPTVPLSHITDEAQLEQLEQVTTGAIRYAEETLDIPERWRTKVVPVTDPDTGEAVLDPQTGEAKVQKFKVTKLGEQEYTEAGLKQLMRQAKVTKEDQIPLRRKFLAQRAEALRVAAEKFPYLKDKASPDYLQFQQAKRELPILESLPNGDYLTGLLLLGLKTLNEGEAKAKAAATTATKPKVASLPKPSSDQAAASAAPSPNARVTPATAAKAGIAAERASVLAKRGITAAEAAASLHRASQLRNSR